MTLEPWQRDVLERGELYAVGGSVRDRIMGAPVATGDTDYLVRGLTPDALEEILRRHGRVSLVGRSFGVYKFTRPDGVTVDVVFPRVERSTGSGHRDFDVRWDPEIPVEDDLRRRDFTVNAIAEDVASGRRVDPCGGVADIAAKVIRMVFTGTFEEDPLRILRGIRFAARFGFTIEADTWSQMRARADLVGSLSAERVRDELDAVMTECASPRHAFELMHDAGVLPVILPEVDRGAGVTQNEYHPDDVFVHSLKTCDAAPRDDLLVRWAALLHDVAKVETREVVRDEKGERVVFYGHEVVGAERAREILTRLRHGESFTSDCAHLVREHMFHYEPEWRDATVRRFIRRVTPELVDALFALREADCRSRDLEDELRNLDALRARVGTELARSRTFKVTDLAVDGRDVMDACGIAEGPAVGRILEELLDAVLEEPSRNTREELIPLAQRLAAGEG